MIASADLSDTTNGADRVSVGVDYAFTNYVGLLQRLADEPPPKEKEDDD